MAQNSTYCADLYSKMVQPVLKSTCICGSRNKWRKTCMSTCITKLSFE